MACSTLKMGTVESRDLVDWLLPRLDNVYD